MKILSHPTLPILVTEDGEVGFFKMQSNQCSSKIVFHGFTKGCLNSCGYYRINYLGKQYFVHRLVAETFIPNPDNKPTVDHINRDRTDNSIGNLRWATLSEQKNNSSLVIERLKFNVRQSENPDEYTEEWREYAKNTIYMYVPVRHWRNTHKEWRKAHWKEVQQHCKECRGRRHKE